MYPNLKRHRWCWYLEVFQWNCEKGSGDVIRWKGFATANQNENYIKRKCKHFAGWSIWKLMTNFPFWYILSISLSVYQFISSGNDDDSTCFCTTLSNFFFILFQFSLSKCEVNRIGIIFVLIYEETEAERATSPFSARCGDCYKPCPTPVVSQRVTGGQEQFQLHLQISLKEGWEHFTLLRNIFLPTN